MRAPALLVRRAWWRCPTPYDDAHALRSHRRRRGRVRRVVGEEAADPEREQLDSDGGERWGGEERDGGAPTAVR
jgi:hypothetical protein